MKLFATDSWEPWQSSLIQKYAIDVSSFKPECADLQEDYFFVNKQGGVDFVTLDTGSRLSLNWIKENEKYSRQNFSFTKSHLVRALGLDKFEKNTQESKTDGDIVSGPQRNTSKRVVDGTLGFGSDFFFLWSHGASVTGIDIDPIPCFMVSWELNRVSQALKGLQPLTNDSVVNENLENFLENGSSVEGDALYLDPLFPKGKKSALPKKNMSFLRSRGNNNLDTAFIWTRAKELQFERIVVKRPRKGEHLVSGVSYSIESKLIRYDVYRF